MVLASLYALNLLARRGPRLPVSMESPAAPSSHGVVAVAGDLPVVDLAADEAIAVEVLRSAAIHEGAKVVSSHQSASKA
jgi:hypothetical protein